MTQSSALVIIFSYLFVFTSNRFPAYHVIGFTPSISTISGIFVKNRFPNTAEIVREPFQDSPDTNPRLCIHTKLWSLSSSSKVPEPSESSGTNVPLVTSKFFQLEEKEDKESSSTEIFLSNDGTVTLGDTDGPLALQATGTWSQDNEKFEMTIKRTFQSGQDGSDVGEFKFDVVRGYVGFLESVGGSIAISGSMHLKDEYRGDMEVGYFSMIDTTESKLGSEDDAE